MLWGDEMEYMLLRVDPQSGSVALWLGAETILKEFNEQNEGFCLSPEYGAFMIEGCPKKPWSFSVTNPLSSFSNLHQHLQYRREAIQALCSKDVVVATMGMFPIMGVNIFTYPSTVPFGPIACSRYTSDDLIFPHCRFTTLTAAIRERRGANVCINVPLYKVKLIQKTPDENF
ncbi:glutamate-cysteine ligase [Pelomyxa schiedti]|nr:glutamate-cysteine ligase [Pelomyxa schiedti]